MGVFSITKMAARLLTIVLIVVICTNSIAQDDLAERVEASLERAIEFLRLNQQADGGWEEIPRFEYGVTALCTLALLNAGKAPDDPMVADALDRLDGKVLEDTYCVALQSMVFCAANPSRYASQIEANTRWLLKLQENNGGWGYGEKRTGASDPSNSQFALLGLHEAQRAGVTGLKPAEWSTVFQRAEQYWERLQNGDGGFSYGDGQPGRGSMTCAGIASLAITGSQLSRGEATVQGDDIQCCGNDSDSPQQRIERAFQWLTRRYLISRNPGHSSDHLYYLYALERAGR
ncbi:MAG TPA: hypothetical protein DDW52_07320, partial [Planctomycetaceae bacterium]|nr:hypothetical protein [Planctomycetaceae bacterium]